MRCCAAAVPAGAARRGGRPARARTTSTGAPGSSWSWARATGPSGCRCRPTSARRSPPICAAAGPATAEGRSVFVRVHAPHRALTAGGVTMVVFDAASAGRAGPIHAHRLRHTAATAMLRAGARCPRSARCCGTGRPLTTAIYAKVDRDALAVLARPWPVTRRWPVMTGRCVERSPTTWRCAARSATGWPGRRSCSASSSTTSNAAARRRSPSRRALAWARLPASGDSNWWAYRLSAVRGFATYLHALDPAHEVPAAGPAAAAAAAGHPVPLLRRRDRGADRRRRHAALPAAARPPIATLIGLLAVTGMRVGEAIALDRGDVDLPAGLLARAARQVRQDPRAAAAPHHGRRAAPLPAAADRLHVRAAGTPALLHLPGRHPAALLQRPRHVPAAWSRRPGSTPRSASCRPRIHDLRHTFAVRSLLDAYAAGQDGQARLTLLSTYLGHVAPGQHLLVPVRRARTAGRRPGSGSSTTWRSRPMSALAPTLQAFFTDRLIRQRHASAAHHRRLPRHAGGCCSASPPSAPARQPSAARPRRPRRAADRRRSSTTSRRERGNSVRTRNARLAAIHSLFRYAALRHPEHAAHHRTRPGDPAQTLRPGTGHLPHRARGRRAARRPRPDHLDRPARPRAAAARRPDRAADLRADRPHPRRRAPRHRRARRLPRQRTQGPDHPAHQRHRRGPARLAR